MSSTKHHAFWITLQHSAKSAGEIAEHQCLPGFARLIRIHTAAFLEIPTPNNDDELAELNLRRVNLREIAASIDSASQNADQYPQFATQIMEVTRNFSEQIALATYSRPDSQRLADEISKIVTSQS